jgi:DNA-binding phage protein
MAATATKPKPAPSIKLAPDAVRPANQWPYRYEVVPRGRLSVDHRYQRKLTDFVNRVKRDWNPALVGTLIVSERSDGTLSIIDGQTRWEGSEEHVDSLPCLIYEELTLAEEAALFADLQTKRRNMRTYERFRAQLQAGQPQAVTISRVATANGFDLAVEETSHTLRAVAALERVLNDADEDHLNDVLRVISSAWGPTRDAARTDMVRGVSRFILNQERLDLERLIERLSRTTPDVLRHRAAAISQGRGAGGSTAAGKYMAEAILTEYMKRR